MHRKYRDLSFRYRYIELHRITSASSMPMFLDISSVLIPISVIPLTVTLVSYLKVCMFMPVVTCLHAKCRYHIDIAIFRQHRIDIIWKSKSDSKTSLLQTTCQCSENAVAWQMQCWLEYCS